LLVQHPATIPLWGWPALDVLGVRWFVTAGLPPDQIRVMERHGFQIVQREAWFLLWQRPAPPLARMQQWRVRVDGRPDELLRVDHAFRGVRVPAGSHEVVFTYEDRAMRLAWGWRSRPASRWPAPGRGGGGPAGRRRPAP
jgi:hypothetical protein